MAVTIEDIRRLKELTGVGLTDAKSALVETGGDFDKALEAMRKKGLTKAEKRGEREARSGVIDAYVHDGRIGVLVELNCETDFVARVDSFKNLAHELALQIAAMNPKYISMDSVPLEDRDRVRAEAEDRVKSEGKPADIATKIVDGQVRKYFEDLVLMSQPYFKDETKTIEALIKEHIAKTGENIVVRQMKRMELGVTE